MHVLPIVTAIVELVICAVVLGAIPWAIGVSRELGEIKQALLRVMLHDEQIDALQSSVSKMEVRVANMESRS